MVKRINAKEAKKIMDSGDKFQLIDVRNADEYREAHIKGSKLMPLDTLKKTIEKEVQDKNEKLLVYCASGMRSGKACKILNDLGYRNVYNIGGIVNWPYGVEK